jgi:hypothetical protein
VAHETSLKAAKTSYFKTDFVWALKIQRTEICQYAIDFLGTFF